MARGEMLVLRHVAKLKFFEVSCQSFFKNSAAELWLINSEIGNGQSAAQDFFYYSINRLQSSARAFSVNF